MTDTDEPLLALLDALVNERVPGLRWLGRSGQASRPGACLWSTTTGTPW